jgi:ribonucleoside-diphosphate reductase beta chain
MTINIGAIAAAVSTVTQNSVDYSSKPAPLIYRAKNWNERSCEISYMAWDQLNSQIWIDTELKVSADKGVWKSLTPEQQEVYKKALGGLTLLDTEQADTGMPLIGLAVTDHQQKATIANMAYMENIHTKSYSTIFTTLLEKFQIDEVFRWVDQNKYLQWKANRIVMYYENIDRRDPVSIYLAMVASVFLESFLFYSGFFYPLYLAGQSMMTNSAEMIKLILRDESVHGLYIGQLAQKIFVTLTPEEQEHVMKETYALLEDLMENEIKYTNELYTSIGLNHDVREFLKYNANKALMNLGLDEYYQHEPVNPIILNGLSVDTDTHDFFSQKGNGYVKANVEELSDDDFEFDF